MDDQQAGIRIRAARVRRGWRQRELARAARVSPSTVSRIERGHLDRVALGVLRRICAALEIRAEVLLRSRGGDLERLVSARHAGLAEVVLGWFPALVGWIARPEVSFNVWGERGIVDVLAWHAPTRSLLVIEIKTALVDVGELLGTLDRKRRLAAEIAAQLGWRPATVSVWLVMADGATNRRHVAAHAATFRAALPDGVWAAKAWLRSPVGEIRALTFLSDSHRGTVRSNLATPRRVRVASKGLDGGGPRTSRAATVPPGPGLGHRGRRGSG